MRGVQESREGGGKRKAGKHGRGQGVGFTWGGRPMLTSSAAMMPDEGSGGVVAAMKGTTSIDPGDAIIETAGCVMLTLT